MRLGVMQRAVAHRLLQIELPGAELSSLEGSMDAARGTIAKQSGETCVAAHVLLHSTLQFFFLS